MIIQLLLSENGLIKQCRVLLILNSSELAKGLQRNRVSIHYVIHTGAPYINFDSILVKTMISYYIIVTFLSYKMLLGTRPFIRLLWVAYEASCPSQMIYQNQPGPPPGLLQHSDVLLLVGPSKQRRKALII